MATGGDQVTGKKIVWRTTSDEKVDFRCCVCERKKVKRDAVYYCVSCQEYYCQKCIQIHNDFPTMSDHVTLDKSHFKSVRGVRRLPSIPTERCADHPTKIIDIFCESHEEVGCATCMATKHESSCAKIYIPENIDLLYDIEKIKRSEQQLRSAIHKVEIALNLRQRCLKQVLKVVENAGRQLDHYTDQIIKNVTEIKQKTRDKLESIRTKLESDLSKQTAVLNTEMLAAKATLQKTTSANSESNNKSQQIVCSSLADMKMKKCENANRILVCPNVKEILFHPHIACEDFFKDVKCKSFGEFSFSSSAKYSLSVPYKVLKVKKTSVKVKADKKDSWIFGLCSLDDGKVLLADYNNKCLKRLSASGTSVSDCLQLPGGPWSVAGISQREAAVTLREKQQVQIIALDTTMKTTKTLNLDFECRFISYYNNELFISDLDTVYVYTVAGKLLRQFSRDSTGHTLFSGIRSIAVSESGRVLFIANEEKGLIAVERKSGRQLWCYKGDDLDRAKGVCVDGRGGVFVCGGNSHNVLQFSESGEKIGEIVTRADGILHPKSVGFVAGASILFVTQDNKDIMQYQLII